MEESKIDQDRVKNAEWLEEQIYTAIRKFHQGSITIHTMMNDIENVVDIYMRSQK